MDEVFHYFYDQRGWLFLLYIAAILVLLWHLAQSIGSDLKRTVIAMAVWTTLGFCAVSLAALGSDFLQGEYNTDAYKRMTPDDYLYWTGVREWEYSNPDVLQMLFRPNAFDNYTWARMNVAELGTMALMAAAAAGSLYALRRKRAILRAIVVPVSLFVILNLYVWVFAPWAYALDYDYFIGDRVLGAVADNFFVFYSDDPTAGIFVFANVVAIVGMILLWPPNSRSGRPEPGEPDSNGTLRD